MVRGLCICFIGDGVRSFIPELEIKEIERLVVESLHRDLSGWKDKGFLFTTHGILDNVDSRKLAAQHARWSKVFGIKLVADGVLVINAKHELVDAYNDGDQVEVVCYPTINVFNGQVQLQMELVAMRLATKRVERSRTQSSRQRLSQQSSVRAVRHVFPIRTQLHVDLIYSSASSAKVDEDFLRALGQEGRSFHIHRVPVRMSSVEQIAAAIMATQADVVVLIRGGGAEAEFEVFNHPEVVAALAECDAYRIVGLGHSANTTQLDAIADYAASVPADAGAHLSKQMANIMHFIKAHNANETSQAFVKENDLFSEQESEEDWSPKKPQNKSYTIWVILLVVALVVWFVLDKLMS